MANIPLPGSIRHSAINAADLHPTPTRALFQRAKVAATCSAFWASGLCALAAEKSTKEHLAVQMIEALHEAMAEGQVVLALRKHLSDARKVPGQPLAPVKLAGATALTAHEVALKLADRVCKAITEALRKLGGVEEWTPGAWFAVRKALTAISPIDRPESEELVALIECEHDDAVRDLPSDDSRGDQRKDSPPTPRWDGVTRTLWLGDKRLHVWKKWAMNQHRLLDEFQAAGWPPRLPSKLSGERLKDTVGELNDNLEDTPLRFRRDGSGCGVTWQVIP